MKKLLLGLLLLVSWSPYLFLATSVEHPQYPNGIEKAYDCTVTSGARESQLIGFTETYFRPIKAGAFREGTYKIAPEFFLSANIKYARCGTEEFTIGDTEYIKVGDKAHVYTRETIVKLFGKEIYREQGIEMFGSSWDGNKEGQTVLRRLYKDKEIKLYDGKEIK